MIITKRSCRFYHYQLNSIVVEMSEKL